MGNTPITAHVPGVEDSREKEMNRGGSQPPSFSVATDGEFRRDLLIAIVALAGIAAHLLLRFVLHSETLPQNLPLYAALVFGGAPLVYKLIQKSLAREFGSDLLAGISIISSALMGQYLVGAIVVLMLSGGTVLEEFATQRASSVLEALSKRMPETAHRKTQSGIVDIKVAEIAVGDILTVFPHEICPVDGIVVEGQGRMNEAYLTGEPFETSKAEGANVISGAINGDTALGVAAAKLPIDSRYARIMNVMRETQASRPRLRRLGDILGAWYTPLAVTIAVASWILSGDSHSCTGNRHAVPASAGNPRSNYRSDFAFGSAQHHHQEPGCARTGWELHHINLRQDWDAHVRASRTDANTLRTWIFSG